MEPIFQRSAPGMRKKVAAGLRVRASFDATVAEVMCGARLERLGGTPVMEGVSSSGRQPDCRCALLNQEFFVEVYAPEPGPRDSLLDDVAYHLRAYEADGSAMIDVSRLERDSKHAKVIAGRIKSVMSQLRTSGHSEAIAFVPFGATLTEWVTKLGEAELQYPVGQDPEFFGRFHVDGQHGFRLSGVVDGRVADWKRDAREELRGLGQLQKGHANVLVVDLTAKNVIGYMIDAYKEIAGGVFKSHPELSAILLVWRHFGLQPSPSRHHEVRAGYLPLPSSNPEARQLSTELLCALRRPGLILQGRTE